MQWDYIIVGAGSAGCALAYELAYRARNKVLLIEAGGSNRSAYIKIPALVFRAGKKFDWGYISQADPSRDGRTDEWTRGRVLGGSSSINGTMFVRGAPHDFERWAAAGNMGWSYADVLPLYQQMEASDQPGDLRGHEGRLCVRTVKGAHALSGAFIQSAVNAGFPLNPDYNGESQEGVSYAQLSQRRGFRCSAADAFVAPLMGRSNFSLLLNAHVARIDIENGRATGVTVVENDASKRIAADRVVLCAGAINSPKLLMLSGVGAASQLRALGIDPVVDAPQVGRNLQEHPLLRLVYKTRVPSNNVTGGVLQRLRIAWDFALRGEGPIASAFEAAAFLKTSAELAHADVQLHFIPLGYLERGENLSPFLDYPSVSVYLNKSYPKSRGRIRLKSGDPLEAPLIDCRLLEDAEDLLTMARGIELIRSIMAAGPMRELVEEEIAPGRDHASNEALMRFVRTQTSIAYHPVGTARMGTDPFAVVTPDLRVNGVEGLWVADASIMPDLISGNTNAVCMMIGMKLGRQLTAAQPHVSSERPSRASRTATTAEA